MTKPTANVENIGHLLAENRFLRGSLKKRHAHELPAACFEAEQAYNEGGGRLRFVEVLEQACLDYPTMEVIIRAAWSPGLAR